MRQYHAEYAGGQEYVWNVMLGLIVGDGSLGLGVDLDEHPSIAGQSSENITR